MWYLLPAAEATHTHTSGGVRGAVVVLVVMRVVVVVVGGALGGGLVGGTSMWMSSLHALASTLMLTFTVFTFEELRFTPSGSRTRLQQPNMSAWGFCVPKREARSSLQQHDMSAWGICVLLCCRLRWARKATGCG